MTGRRATVLAALALVAMLPGCAQVTEGVDRNAYYAARDVIVAEFPVGDAVPPPLLREVPGLPPPMWSPRPGRS